MTRHINRRRLNKIYNEIVTTHETRPTIRDLAEWTRTPRPTVYRYIGVLEQAGQITVANRRAGCHPLKLTPNDLYQPD